MNERRRERVLALLALLLASTCVAAARAIEDSLLADSVGAGGVPQGVGIAMGLAALALFAKSFTGNAVAVEGQPAHSLRHAALRTSALVLLLVVYATVLPLAGYPLAVSLLVLAAGRLAGAPLKWPLFVCAALAGPLLWALFDALLKVRMPLGSLWI